MIERKPLFWIIFTAISFFCLLYFINNFNRAFPSLALDIKMNRTMALEASKKLIEDNNWKPNNANTAVTFSSEREIQTFVELEGGGIEKFKSLFEDSLYFPYGWTVRHFQEKNPNEILVKFKPSGDPYGFYQKLGEDEPGDSLGRDSAFAVAIKNLSPDWNIDLSNYKLIDESEKIKPNGRIDHQFVFKRKDINIGDEGSIRLRLSVSGDKLTEINHYIEVPEGFKRRFSEMRSSNDMIAFSANMFMLILYGLLGCIYGIFILIRQRRILWRGALKWGLGISFIQSLMQINFLPMLWMEYDTSTTLNSFLIQVMIGAVVNFLAMGLIYTLSFIAAEGLSRKAFPNHVQFWKLFSSRTGNSYTVLGQSLGGYLGTAIFMFYALAFYTFSKQLGWWSPTDTEYDPNILAAYFPWLTSIAISLGAGFWEECLFRAVPIAGAALIGERYGRRNLFIGIGMVVQSLIFGAAHANYPVQPAYARVIELMIPSLIFGALYIKYGLLPGIIMHYAYDVAMISLQIFSADVPGIWMQRAIIIFFLLVPIWVILIYRLRFKRWFHKLGSVYNKDWELPPIIKEKSDLSLKSNLNKGEKPKIFKKPVLIILSIVGITLWIISSKFNSNFSPLKLSKSEAIELAENAFKKENIAFGQEWRREVRATNWSGVQEKFVWMDFGREKFNELKGNYISDAGWIIRYRMREGDVDQRAEEYSCFIDNNGKARISIKLPESKARNNLNESEARELAEKIILDRYSMELNQLVELEASSLTRPNRIDWFFKYKENSPDSLNELNSDLRINVSIAGDEVINTWREVFIPEGWKRADEEKKSKFIPLEFLITIFLILPIISAISIGLYSWSKKKLNTKLFIKGFIFIAILRLVFTINSYSMTLWDFTTTKPFMTQLYMSIFSSFIIQVVLVSLIGGLLLSYTYKITIEQICNNDSVIKGIFLGIFLSGINSFVGSLYPQLEPLRLKLQDLNFGIPIIGSLISYFSNYFQITILYSIILAGLTSITSNWTKNHIKGILLLIITSFLFSFKGEPVYGSIGTWFGISILLVIIIYFILKDFLQYNLHLIPVITGVITILEILRIGIMNSHSNTFIITFIGIILIAYLSQSWSKFLLKSANT